MDYSHYITPRTQNDAKALDDSIEELLTKLEEYCGLVDIVRSDTTLCLKRTLPEIRSKSESMKAVFDRIDEMEVFVGMVKAHVATMEALLDQAEAEMSSSTVKKFLSAMPSIFGRKSQPRTERPLSKFEPPEVFRTEDYFPKPEQGAAAAEEKEGVTEKHSTKEEQRPVDDKQTSDKTKNEETEVEAAKQEKNLSDVAKETVDDKDKVEAPAGGE